MIKKENNLDKIKKLAGISSLNENKGGQVKSNVLSVKTALDGKTYGIIKEGNHYYIKESSNSDYKNEQDFDYIGGLRNRVNKRYSYTNLNEAMKNHIIFVKAINERLGKDIDNDADDFKVSDDFNNDTPEGDSEPQFDDSEFEGGSSEEGGEDPVDATPEDNEGGEESGEGDEDNIDHYVGKLTASLRDADNNSLTTNKIKSIINSILAAVPLENLSDEDESDIVKRIKTRKTPVDELVIQGINESVLENGNTFHKCHHILESVMNGQKNVATDYYNSLKKGDFLYVYMQELDFNDTMIEGYKEYFGEDGKVDDEPKTGEDVAAVNNDELTEETIGGTVEDTATEKEFGADDALLLYLGYNLSKTAKEVQVDLTKGSVFSDTFGITVKDNGETKTVRLENFTEGGHKNLEVSNEAYDEFLSMFKQ